MDHIQFSKCVDPMGETPGLLELGGMDRWNSMLDWET